MRLPPGLYEHLLSIGLDRAANDRRAQSWEITQHAPDETLAPELLARQLYVLARRTLASLPTPKDESRLQHQVAVTNELIALLRRHAKPGAILDDDALLRDGELLCEARPPSPTALARPATPRPHIALSQSGLLVNGHRDYQIGTEVAREIASADRVWLLCAFVRFAGLRLVKPALESLVARGGEIRVIASVYTGSTEKRALDELVKLGAKVKVSYETAQTRLHAKAWIFHRQTELGTAYIGSSNLTHSALVEGLEWNVRVSQADNPSILERVSATFDQYWNEPEFVEYEPERDGERLSLALAEERGGGRTDDAAMAAIVALGLELEPKPHQKVMLEELDAERARGCFENLVVSATGTGKTWVSAFDYARLRAAGHRTLLFVAHREEILDQSRRVFQLVLRNASFGERWVAGDRPEVGTHVFASIQSLAQHLGRLAPDAFDVVIVDEFHHAAAPTYDALLGRLRPKVLLGLTATPERADGKSVLGWFAGRIATEVRLWQALDQGLLCPFHYFGVADGTDLSAVKFSRGRYVQAELENVLTADDARLKNVLRAVAEYVHDPASMRALGFCVGVEHAKFMARAFTAARLPALALHADSPDAERKSAVARLRRGELRALFTVDLFNEGVDIPEVDTVLLLRPTESATVFLQQLGRGLRWAEGKSVLTVLDFIGQAHKDYRFDVRYRALAGGTQRDIERALDHDFPHLPAGCAIRLERMARQAILENLRGAITHARRALLDDLCALGPTTNLRQFLTASDRALADVYARPDAHHTFTALRRDAGFEQRPPSPHEPPLCRALGRLLHVDDPERTQRWLDWLRAPTPPRPAPDATRDQRLQWMLFAALGHRRRPLTDLPRALEELWTTEPIRAELIDLLETLADQSRTHAAPLDPNGIVPIATHAHYSLLELMAAYGLTSKKKGNLLPLQTGAYWAGAHHTELLFITLEKSDSEYSPTTRYEDYPISPTLFHWESQNTVSEQTDKGKRYLCHAERGDHVVLFVRERKQGTRDETAPYVCLGNATYVRHESERPMRIVWRLERAMPARMYQAAKVAAG